MLQVIKTSDAHGWNAEVLITWQKSSKESVLSLSGKQPYYQQVIRTLGLEIWMVFQVIKTSWLSKPPNS